jgi:hypothetical protein
MVDERYTGQIVSHTPGRARVRLSRQNRRKDLVSRIHQHLENQPTISRVESNVTTGSVIAWYSPNALSREDLVAVYRDAGVDLTDASDQAQSFSDFSPSTSALAISRAFDGLDRQLSALFGRTFDLRVLLPLTLGAAGVYKIARFGFQFELIPGYVLLWYAMDSFVKFNRDSIIQRDRTDRVVSSDT